MWMERRKLVQLWQSAGEEVALATIVRVEGSSYRRPGASMMVTRGGQRVGMVSGGCLEAEVSQKIWWLTESGPCVKSYDTSFDEDGKASYGLGCGGRITLLLERGDTARVRVEAIRRSIEERTPSAVVTVIEGGTAVLGSRVVLRQDEPTPLLRGTGLEGAMRKAAEDTLELGYTTSMHLPGESREIRVFAEYVAPPPRLFVFGAGDDAQPVASLAAAMGWEVVVADGRSQLATTARFPSAHRVVLMQQAQWPNLQIASEDAAVVLTHSYQQDREILSRILPLGLRYVGVLGPRRRTVQLVEEVSGSPDAARYLDQLHSPAGLDLGSDGAEVIALSIIAEVQATFEGRSAAPLYSLQRSPAVTA